MHVLVVEDDPSALNSVRLLLESEQMRVDMAATGEEGFAKASRNGYDLILLDLGLPDMHGFDVLKKLRADGGNTPVMVLSATADVPTKARGLWLGADDYVVKPFRGPELIARIAAVTRRSSGRSRAVVQIGRLTVDLDTQWVETDGVRIHLSRKEFSVLELLALRKGQVVTRDMLVDHLYGGRDEPNEKIIEVFVSKIRKKLHSALDGAELIETIWGRGYVLRDPQIPQDSDGPAGRDAGADRHGTELSLMCMPA